MTLTEYLASLKVGDVVTIDTGGHYLHQKTVDHVTPTTVIAGGEKYRRKGDQFNIGLKIRAASSGRLGRWTPQGRILTPDEAALKLHKQKADAAIWQAKQTLSGPLTLSSIPLMRAALDEAEAALREAEK